VAASAAVAAAPLATAEGAAAAAAAALRTEVDQLRRAACLLPFDFTSQHAFICGDR